MTPPISSAAAAAPMPRRRWLALAGLGLPGLWAWPGLSGCSTPGPPPEDYRLALDAPSEAPAPPAAPPSPDVWQLPRSLRLPAYLDRDRLQLPTDTSTLAATSPARWAEPLRDAIPRLLQHDLALWLHTPQVWLGTPPAGWRATHRLSLDIQAFEAQPARDAVRLVARWSIEQASTPAPALFMQADLRAPIQGRGYPAIVQAHRLALWRLAQAIAHSTAA